MGNATVCYEAGMLGCGDTGQGDLATNKNLSQEIIQGLRRILCRYQHSFICNYMQCWERDRGMLLFKKMF